MVIYLVRTVPKAVLQNTVKSNEDKMKSDLIFNRILTNK